MIGSLDLTKLKLFPERHSSVEEEEDEGIIKLITQLKFEQPEIPVPSILQKFLDNSLPGQEEQFNFSREPTLLKQFFTDHTSNISTIISNTPFLSNLTPGDTDAIPHRYLKHPESQQPPFPHLNQLASPTPQEINYVLYGTEMFVDKAFPPEKEESIHDLDRPLNHEFNDLEFRRARDVYGNDFRIFPDTIHPNDIEQGLLGDCYFLSAISALAEWPHRIRAVFVTQTPNQAGIYTMRLYVNGEMMDVTVDQFFPYDHRTGDFAFCTSKDKKSIWPLLLEKAFAKIHGSYQRIESGTMMEALLTLTSSYIETYAHDNYEPSHLWNLIEFADQRDFILMTNVSSDNEKQQIALQEMGLVDHHAYTLIAAKTVEVSPGVREQLLKIRNPWGRFEWKGDWSDASSKWTAHIKQQVDYSDEDDGVFYISLKDFTKFFSRTTVAYFSESHSYITKRVSLKRGDYRLFYLQIARHEQPHYPQGQTPHEESKEPVDPELVQYGTRAQILLFQQSKRQQTGSKNQYFLYDLANFALVKVSSQDSPGVPSFEWIPNHKFERLIHCTCQELYLEAGHYLLFVEVEKEEEKPDSQVPLNLVVRTYQPNSIKFLHPVPHSAEPFFPEKMMEACCVACAKEHQYPENPEMRRYFALSESNTSFAAFFYQNLSLNRSFAEKLSFTMLEGLELWRNQAVSSSEFEVSVGAQETAVVALKRTGANSTRVRYKYATIHEKSLEEMVMKGKLDGRSKQLTDAQGNQIKVWLHSYFETSEGVLTVESKEEDIGINFDFDFSRSQNVRHVKVVWAGCEKEYPASELKSVCMNVAPTKTAHILLQARNSFQGMLVSYGYAFKLMHL